MSKFYKGNSLREYRIKKRIELIVEVTTIVVEIIIPIMFIGFVLLAMSLMMK